MRPLISVIVPVYKVEQYLDKCIKSLLNQTYSNLEVILVDDGSPDSCPQMCDKYAKLDDRVQVVHKKNGGLSDARNAGLDIAKGEYIGFVDSDDEISLIMYEFLCFKAMEYSADIVACNETSDITQLIDSKSVDQFECEEIVVEQDILKYYLENEGHAVWKRLYKSSLFQNLRFEVGEQNEDVLASYYLMKECKKFVKLNANFYYWNLEPTSLSRSPLRTLKNQSERVLKLIEQEYEEETINAARLRSIQFNYRLITRSIRFGFANSEIEHEYNGNLPTYLGEIQQFWSSINNSSLFRKIDRIQIKFMLISMPIYSKLYMVLRSIYGRVV